VIASSPVKNDRSMSITWGTELETLQRETKLWLAKPIQEPLVTSLVVTRTEWIYEERIPQSLST